jgi:hypothetical protein
MPGSLVLRIWMRCMVSVVYRICDAVLRLLTYITSLVLHQQNNNDKYTLSYYPHRVHTARRWLGGTLKHAIKPHTFIDPNTGCFQCRRPQARNPDNATRVRNLLSSLALQVFKPARISSIRPGGAGGISGRETFSGRETCVRISHHTSADKLCESWVDPLVIKLTAFEATNLPNPKGLSRSLDIVK